MTQENDQPEEAPQDNAPETGNSSKPVNSTPEAVDGAPAEDAPSKDELKAGLATSIQLVWRFLRATMSISAGTDREGTVEGIKKDVDFKGVNVWILIFSIFIASIGLNMNSAAVVIGAMLISPLMGPILGIGLAIGTNDWKLLQRGSRSLAVATTIAIVTSAVYFLITPLSDASDELIGRTAPTFLDVFVAIFGGLAGIIAGSRKEKTNVIPGVAIATALMPPLCTAGYGLATLQWDFFFGAFYLFLLNCIFISLSTLVVVRYLKFPLKEFVNPATERRVRGYVLAAILTVILPSGYILYKVVGETIFNRSANSFIEEIIEPTGVSVLQPQIVFNDSVPRIEVTLVGDYVTPAQIGRWKGMLGKYGLDPCVLKINQSRDMSQEIDQQIAQLEGKVEGALVEKLLYNTQEDMEEKERQIRHLLRQISTFRKDSIPYDRIYDEVHAQYPEMERFLFGKAVEIGANGAMDTVATLHVAWPETVSEEEQAERDAKLASFLQLRWELDTVKVLHYSD